LLAPRIVADRAAINPTGRGALVGDLTEPQTVEVAPWHAEEFGLSARPRAHVREAVCGPRPFLDRLSSEAVVGEAALAVLAVAAGDVEGQDHSVADLDLVDSVPHLDDLAHVLVAEPASRLEVGATLVHVQVGAADVGRGDAHEHIGRALDPGIRDVSDVDLSGSVVHDCLHVSSSMRCDLASAAGRFRDAVRPQP
jgi:hypothetical protein